MSISPHSMTWLTASAMVPSTATETRIASRLVALRNLSLASVNAATSTARNSKAGASGRTIHRRRAPPEASLSAVARASLISGCLLSGAVGGLPIPTSRGRGHHLLLARLTPPELARHPALPHDHDPIRHREDLLQLGGD